MLEENPELLLKIKEKFKEDNSISCKINSQEASDKKYTIIYLDWNIVKKLKIDGISNNNPKVILPFSEIHIRDLLPSFESLNNQNKSTQYFNLLIQDLQYLSLLTQNRKISLVSYSPEIKGNCNNVIIEKFPEIKDAKVSFSDNDVYKELQNIIKDRENEEERIKQLASKLYYPYKIQYPENTVKFENIDIQKIFKENKFLYDKQFILKYLSYYFFEEKNIFNTPELYKELRNSLKNQEAIINDENFKVFLTIYNEDNIEILEKNFSKISEFWNTLQYSIDSSISPDEKNYNNMALLEFSPIFHDKISKKNKSENVARDCRHFQLATYCDYFITSDKKFLKKVNFLLKMCPDIKTKIIEYNDLIEMLK